MARKGFRFKRVLITCHTSSDPTHTQMLFPASLALPHFGPNDASPQLTTRISGSHPPALSLATTYAGAFLSQTRAAQISHAHPQILRLGETIHLFQPPDAPGGSWEEMEAVAWLIEQNPDGQVNQLSLQIDTFAQMHQGAENERVGVEAVLLIVLV